MYDPPDLEGLEGDSPASVRSYFDEIGEGCDDPKPSDPDYDKITTEAQAMLELAYGKD
jgi:hypothetical protein